MGMMWFGKRHEATIYEDTTQTETPVGTPCVHCEEPIAAGDDGFFYANGPVAHRECFLRGIIGSTAHQERRCSCFVPGASHDEEGMSRREAAKAALDCFEGRAR